MGITDSLGEWLYGSCFRGFYWATGRRTYLADIAHLDERYRAPRSTIEQRVRSSMLAALQHALDMVPYYRDGWADKIRAISESTVLNDLAQFPILTKAVIRDQKERLLSTVKRNRTRWRSSGGSTGEPVWFLHDQGMRRAATANQLMFMLRLGYQIGELHLHIWGVPERNRCLSTKVREWLYQRLHHQIYRTCFQMADHHLREWLALINRTRPAVIEAYADAVYHLAGFILRNDGKVHRPRGIITGAAGLSKDMKKTIQRAFRCPVLDRYGSREVGDVACSCLENDELHVTELTAYLEIVDDANRPCPPGVEGDVLVTLFTNSSMPLIRYRIEDRAAWAVGPCPCGRTTKRLAYVAGRSTDYFLTSRGEKINGHGLIHLTFSVPGLRRFQYRQVAPDRVQLAVVALSPDLREVMLQGLQVPLQQIGEALKGVRIEVVVVDDILPSRSGKYRYVINELIHETNPPGHQ